MAGIEVQHSGFQFVKEKVQNAFSTNVISFEKTLPKIRIPIILNMN